MKSWLIRIIPPRPNFDKDASPDEQAQMEAHFHYWKDLFEKGICLFGGPVLDPQGVYGLLAIRAGTEDEARVLAAADPSVQSGLNRIELAEMRVAFPPKSLGQFADNYVHSAHTESMRTIPKFGPGTAAPTRHAGAQSWGLQRFHSCCIPKPQRLSGFFTKKKPHFLHCKNGYTYCGTALVVK